jgi:peptidoglycan/xylan/chitin deacetylase (PgdA/CDA1 family)
MLTTFLTMPHDEMQAGVVAGARESIDTDGVGPPITRPVTPFRWHIKKSARAAVAAAAWASGARSKMQAQLRVLTYHAFGTRWRDPFCIPGDVFETQMAYLARSGRAVSPTQLRRFLANGNGIPDGAVLVTIDDGFQSLHSVALPILVRHGIPAIAFVTAGLIGIDPARRAASAGASERYLTWNEVEQIARAGIEIGSHAWTHRSLGRMAASEVRDEACRSRESIEQHVARPVTAFAYPFGTRADFSPSTGLLLARCGYSCAFTSQHGAVARGVDAFALPRIKIEAGDPPWMFGRLMDGGLDAWQWVDRSLWQLQARGR